MSKRLPLLPLRKDIRKGFYRHYKGDRYFVHQIARHSETLEEMVIYQAWYGNFETWIRPADMFVEEVEYKEKKVLRFTREK